ncbi:hypothetical protein P170DRAFT_460792 [Aspergillus steynii IBT 23096]|uniref:BZIP domain-containing protein n=1 Tax=Aspergillus steynii IBT 23096 TaxID=1392250 RepID=A0A2I2GPE5_9EURO|nr:uncharacterized protein P170DRAFT_460792 [Aspergillus steynii IBT 23096]PLB54746.1 hypothetical protein P170DRAFT_460792 [Aspergillus steynii IBT 23096]
MPRLSYEEQRERKRAQDRAAQRASRNRAKDRVARLEHQIAQLQAGGDEAMMEQMKQMQQERSQLRTLADQLLNIAGALDTTLGPVNGGSGLSSPQPTRKSLLGEIVHDYEALKSTHPTPAMPLTDPHSILVGVLNGWNVPVSVQEEPVHRLMAHLHRRLMLERPLVRPIDQLAILYLIQMSLLFLLAQLETYRAYLSHVPGWLYPTPAQSSIRHNVTIDMLPWPQLRLYLLSQPDVESYNTQPCNDLATQTLRSMIFVPEINFEDAYLVGPDRRLTLSPQFRQLFSPEASSAPFAVTPSFLDQYPNLRGIVPEWKSHGHGDRTRSEAWDLVAQDGYKGNNQANPGLLDGRTSNAVRDQSSISRGSDLPAPSLVSVPPASPTHSVFAGEPMGNWYEALGFLAETDSVPSWLLEPAEERLDNL